MVEGDLTSETLPNSAIISPLLSMTSFWRRRRSCRRVVAEFEIPRSSSNARASRNSESAYEVAKTAVTLEEKGLALLKDEPVESCGIETFASDGRRKGNWPNESVESVVMLAHTDVEVLPDTSK